MDNLAPMPVHVPPISRRSFLATSAVAACASITADAVAAPAAVDPHRIALLSDTHIDADVNRVARGVNMAEHLRAACTQMLAPDKRPARLLINGDLAAGSGRAQEYATAIDLLKPVRAAGVPIDVALGNCDHRDRFRAAVPGAGAAPNDKHVAVIDMPRVRWLILDSLNETGQTRGLLGAAQLKWLADTLDADATKPAVVMTHHNPEIDAPGEKPTGIADSAALFDVLSPRRQAKALVFGHTHRWNHRRRDVDGLHLVNLPAVSYVFAPDQTSAWVDAHIEQNGIRLHLRTLDPKHAHAGQKLDLAWRT